MDVVFRDSLVPRDRPGNQAAQESQAPPETQETQESLRRLLAKLLLHRRASLALKDHQDRQDRPEVLVSLAKLDPMGAQEAMLSPEPLDQGDPQGPQENLDPSGPPESQVCPLSQSHSPPESPARRERSGPQAHLDHLGHQETMDLQDPLDPRGSQVPMELRGPKVNPVNQETQVRRALVERREFARSTAPPMVESSSRMEPAVKRRWVLVVDLALADGGFLALLSIANILTAFAINNNKNNIRRIPTPSHQSATLPLLL